jgi:hypothetical protein
MAKPDYYGTSDGGETQSYKGKWLNFTYSELKSLVWRMTQWPGSTIARLSRSMGMTRKELCRGLDDLRTLGELGQMGNGYYIRYNDPDLIREYVGTVMAFGIIPPQPGRESFLAAAL